MISKLQALGARAEAAAQEGLDHPDMRLLHLQAFRHVEENVIGNLGGGVQGQVAAFGIVFGQRGVRLDMDVVDLGEMIGLLAHQIGRREPGLGIAELVMNLAQHVVGLFGVDGFGAGAIALRASK